MIDIKENCCGCEACVHRCPKSCITMREDKEGFLYPEIDKSKCIDCGLCEKVCPIINITEERKPIAVYIAKHKDEQIRMASSSGGAFTAIAASVLEDGGAVFGARFNQDWEIIHSYAETKEGLDAFRGSKYVQSRIGDSYKETEKFLKAGRKVLFSGTPCQVAGLKHFLRKGYDNLLTVDIICYGVPSPKVWLRYLEETAHDFNVKQCDGITPPIDSISFRDKKTGWKGYCLTISTHNPISDKTQIITSRQAYNDFYLKGFLSNLYLRKSCYQCPFKSWKSRSDITIADAWGIDNEFPQYDDDKGYNLVIIQSEKGKEFITQINDISTIKESINEDYIKNHNKAAYQSAKPHKKRNLFFKLLNESDMPFAEIIKKCLPAPSFMDKVLWSINRRLKKIYKR